jgi:hypothetical protein
VTKLLGALAIVAILFAVGDVAARRWAEGELARRIEASVPGSHATVHVSSFPFLGRLVASGSVSKITAHIDKVANTSLPFAFFDLEVDGVKLDRNTLIQDQKVKLQSIRRGVVRAEITEAALSSAVGRQVRLGNGELQVVRGGVSVTATVAVVDNRLVVSGPASLGVAIPKLPILPCAVTATVRPGRLDVSCEVHEIPPALVTA